MRSMKGHRKNYRKGGVTKEFYSEVTGFKQKRNVKLSQECKCMHVWRCQGYSISKHLQLTTAGTRSEKQQNYILNQDH